MRAIGYEQSLPLTDPNVLIEQDIPTPSPQARDLLVRVKAISVNPVDTKARMKFKPERGEFRILGWDVAGVVEKVGSSVSGYSPGEEVFYAGSITRPGANSEFHLVDERLVGRKPRSLTFEEAAALPLTSLTAWEGLFDRLQVEGEKSLLVIGGAGGVGSITIQLAKTLTALKVFATAGRPESQAWVKQLGADHVVEHGKKLVESVRATGRQFVDYIFCANDTDHYFDAMAELVAPQGKIVSIVETHDKVDLVKLMQKSASFHWELMYTRSSFQTADMDRQRSILNDVSKLIDDKKIRTTVGKTLGPMTVESLKEAHRLLESGNTVGKIVLGGFQ